MNINLKLRNLQLTVAHLTSFAIGLVCIVAALIIGNCTLSVILLSIGTSMIASVIMAWVLYRNMSFENDIREIIIQWGLKGLFEARSQMNEPSNKLMEKSKTLDIIAFGLSSLRNSNHIKMLEERIEKGEIHVRILTLDPNSVFCDAVDNFEGGTPENTKFTIQQLIEWGKQFNKKNFEY